MGSPRCAPKYSCTSGTGGGFCHAELEVNMRKRYLYDPISGAAEPIAKNEELHKGIATRTGYFIRQTRSLTSCHPDSTSSHRRVPRGGGLGGIYFPTTWHIVAKHHMVRCDTQMVRHNTRVSRLPPHLHTFLHTLRVSTKAI